MVDPMANPPQEDQRGTAKVPDEVLAIQILQGHMAPETTMVVLSMGID